MNLRLYLEDCEATFNLEKAVCNHGFFMMAPNVWNPSTKSLERPLRLSNSSSVNVSISHPSGLRFLVIQVHEVNNISREDEQLILQQVARMLRISEKDERDVKTFQEVHKVAKEKGFGRLFRSPCLFEDIIKSILLCNCTRDRTLDMASRLCKLQQKLADHMILPKGSRLEGSKKRKREALSLTEQETNSCTKEQSSLHEDERIGDFPSAKELASLDEALLNEHCNLGYRASYILRIAQKVENRVLSLEKIESIAIDAASYDVVVRRLKSIKGLGTFATATVLLCIGCYHIVPSDTETVRLLQEVHGMKECTKRTVEKDAKEVYSKFAPFQSLAYWLELVEDYERKCGKLSELNCSDYSTVSGSFHAKHRRAKS